MYEASISHVRCKLSFRQRGKRGRGESNDLPVMLWWCCPGHLVLAAGILLAQSAWFLRWNGRWHHECHSARLSVSLYQGFLQAFPESLWPSLRFPLSPSWRICRIHWRHAVSTCESVQNPCSSENREHLWSVCQATARVLQPSALRPLATSPCGVPKKSWSSSQCIPPPPMQRKHLSCVDGQARVRVINNCWACVVVPDLHCALPAVSKTYHPSQCILKLISKIRAHQQKRCW